jgi:hypothetical protein
LVLDLILSGVSERIRKKGMKGDGGLNSRQSA